MRDDERSVSLAFSSVMITIMITMVPVAYAIEVFELEERYGFLALILPTIGIALIIQNRLKKDWW